MSLQWVVLECFLLAASVCLPIDAAKDYQYLQMVYQWPPAFCRRQKPICNPNPPKHFTIHGLWPSNWTQQPNSFPRIDCRLGVLFNDTKVHFQLPISSPSSLLKLSSLCLFMYNWKLLSY